jgi:hypothetical protein
LLAAKAGVTQSARALVSNNARSFMIFPCSSSPNRSRSDRHVC